MAKTFRKNIGVYTLVLVVLGERGDGMKAARAEVHEGYEKPAVKVRKLEQVVRGGGGSSTDQFVLGPQAAPARRPNPPVPSR